MYRDPQVQCQNDNHHLWSSAILSKIPLRGQERWTFPASAKSFLSTDSPPLFLLPAPAAFCLYSVRRKKEFWLFWLFQKPDPWHKAHAEGDQMSWGGGGWIFKMLGHYPKGKRNGLLEDLTQELLFSMIQLLKLHEKDIITDFLTSMAYHLPLPQHGLKIWPTKMNLFLSFWNYEKWTTRWVINNVFKACCSETWKKIVRMEIKSYWEW